jgi:diguanylate cyclase (GGDEF)-like protein/PAS domain S-box-containing protein
MRVTVEQKVYIGLGLLFALLLGIGLFADRTVAQLVNDSQWVENSLEVKRSVEELPAWMNEIQTTKNRTLSKRVQGNIAIIRRLTAGNDRQQGQLDVLEPLIAAEIANPNTSPELAAEIRKNIALIRGEEDRIFEKRKEQSESAVAQTIIIVRAGALIGLVAVVLAAYMIRIDVRRRRRNAEELDRFFNLSLDMFCIRDFNGRIKRLNSAWERNLGYFSEEMLAKPYTDFIHPEDVERTLAKVKTLSHTNTIAFDNRYRAKDGTYHWLRWNEIAHNGLVYAAARDITERRHAETTLARHADEVALVSQTMDVLQSCETVEDAYKVIDTMAKQLFPNLSGAVYQLAASRNLLERVASWGERAPNENFIGPSDCLGLKRGRPGITLPDFPLHCPHVDDHSAPYICVPMVALNDTIGILHLRQENNAVHVDETHLAFAVRIAEQIALTLGNLRLRESLRVQSIRDPLTGLFNRRYLEESFEREIHRASRNNSPLSVLMLDMDHFKRFNDAFGHDAGDAVLREWGGFLQVRVRYEDLTCRFGGEEFAILLPDASFEEAQDIASRICEDARTFKVKHRNQELGPITISIGVATFPEHGSSVETLLHTADQALYRAKSSGRNQIAVAIPSI